MSAMTIAPPEFGELCCDALYGDVIDPDVVWEEVHKALPTRPTCAAQRNAVRRNVERGSNALGITAGSARAGRGAADDRLQRARGRVSRALAATGTQDAQGARPDQNPKVRAGLAATAVAPRSPTSAVTR